VSEPSASEEPGKSGSRAKVVAVVSLALAAGMLVLIFFSHRAISRIYLLSQEKARLEKENEHLAEENLRLARTVDRLHNDPEMIQDLIRRELNFVKKNEIIIQFLTKDDNPSLRAATAPHRPPPEPLRGAKAGRLPEPRLQSPAARLKTP